MKFTKHIIWDWNGTLVDDTRYCVDLINGILARRSLPGINEGRYKRTFNFPIIDYYKRVGLDLEKETFETISNELISAYIHSRHNLILHDGALKALNFFDARKLPQCMLSCKATRNTASNIKRTRNIKLL
jgi:phosphoglycolate phosphatase